MHMLIPSSDNTDLSHQGVMRTGLFLLSITAPLVIGLGLLLSYCLELSSQLRRAHEEFKKLRTEREWDGRKSVALQKRVAELEGSLRTISGDAAAANHDAFAKLRALVIKTLHPDAAPQDSASERALRSDMFKAIWPEILKIQHDIDHPSTTDARPETEIERRHATPASMSRRNSDEGYHGWRQRRKYPLRGSAGAQANGAG